MGALRITRVCTMAHGLFGQGAARLRELPLLSVTTAAELDALAPGSHRIVRLADGRSLLASAAQFSTADGGSLRCNDSPATSTQFN
jgi:hypothetical protein